MHSIETLRARRLRQEMTGVERRLWARLRLRQIEGHKFRRQVPLGPYCADFACLAARLVIEVDGPTHEDRVIHGARRDSWMEARGFHVLRFRADEVASKTEAVREAIKASLSSPLRPPRLRRGGDSG